MQTLVACVFLSILWTLLGCTFANLQAVDHENTFLTYIRTPEAGDEDKYFLVGDQAVQSTLTGFNILNRNPNPNEGTIVAIQYAPNGYFWGVRAIDSKLELRAGGGETHFQLHPIAQVGGHFTISVEGVPLVAYESDFPFSFYLQTRYPREPPAVFRLVEEGEVGGNYQNLRANIIRTADSISNASLADVDKEIAYRELGQAMRQNGHLSGEEVFYVAHKIRTDVGLTSEAYQTLPNQVQLLSGGANLKWFWKGRGAAGALSVPMKYVTATYSHLGLLPYNFGYFAPNRTWSASCAQIHKLYIPETGARDLVERTSDEAPPFYGFRFKLATDLSRFQVLAQVPPFSSPRWELLYSRNGGNKTTFSPTSLNIDDHFHVEEF